jgi:ATP-dependent protease ClpP protease subunit
MAALRADPDRLKVENAASDTATMWVYDEISWAGVTAEAFAKELAGVTAPSITLRLNSPGGCLFDGIAIYNSLVSHPATVNVQVDGLAASCASVIAMAGDTITMGAGTQMMVHDGFAVCLGNAADMRRAADELDQFSSEIAGFYARRSGGDAATWRAAMLAETWFSGPEALAAGLATAAVTDEPDSVPGDMPVAARFDLSIFNYSGRRQAPAPMVTFNQPPAAVPTPAPTFDATAFRSAVRAAWGTPLVSDYATLLRDAVKEAQ